MTGPSICTTIWTGRGMADARAGNGDGAIRLRISVHHGWRYHNVHSHECWPHSRNAMQPSGDGSCSRKPIVQRERESGVQRHRAQLANYFLAGMRSTVVN
jgi:hypothetical protein